MVERSDRAAPVTFFLAEELSARTICTLGGDAAHHARVRRIDVGERVNLTDGAGVRAEATLVRLTRLQITVEIDRTWSVPPLPPVHVMVPIADRERMLWLAEKLTEIGATSWRPVSWRRSRSVSPRGEGSMFQAKVRARMVGALTQSEGAWLPIMYPDAPIDRAIAAAPEGERFLLAADGERIANVAPIRPPVTLVWGPEGGIERLEQETFEKAGFRAVALAGGILRFETAGVAGVAVIRALISTGDESS